MNIIENLISDLRRKRLWPVAAALIVALIAVPVILSSAGTSTPPPAAPVAGVATPPAPAVPAVSVTATPSNARLTGPQRNPFQQQVKASSATSGSSATSSSGGASSSSSGKAVGSNNVGTPFNSVNPGKSSSTSTTTTTTTPAPTKPTTKYFYFEASIVYAGNGEVPRTLSQVAPLTPLPRATNPLIVFLGVKNDGKTAVFVVSDTVHPTGQGTCLPSRSDCQLLELQAGQSDLFKPMFPGEEHPFTLSLTAVKTVTTTSSKVAGAARANSSAAGREIIARATRRSIALSVVQYSKLNGTVSFHTLSRQQIEHLLRTVGRQAALGVDLQSFAAAP